MEKKNKILLAVIITYATATLMFSLDQWTKQLIINAMPITVDIDKQMFSAYPPYQFLPWLWFTHVVNFGAAFSIFYGKKYLLLSFALIISSGMIYYEFTSRAKRTKVLSASLGFLLAGAAGNVFDRIRLGYVTDFLDFRNNGQNVWPIFNVADVSINIGIALLVIYFLFQEGKQKHEEVKVV